MKILKHTRISIAILAAGLAGLYLGQKLATSSQPTPPATAANAPVDQAAPSRPYAATSAPVVQQAPATTAPEPVGAAMLAQYLAAPNYRAFIYRAMKDPEHGGYAYSAYVLSICSGLNAAPKSQESEAQRAARAALKTRCDMSDSERAQMNDDLFRARLKEPDKDPISRTTRAALTAVSPAERRALLEQVMAFRLPSLALLQAAAPLEEGKGAYFQGRYYDTERGKQFYLGMNLAGCSLGVDCSANSAAALTLCAKRGWCADDVPSALRAGNPDNFEQIQALSKQIVQAVQHRDAAAFVPGV